MAKRKVLERVNAERPLPLSQADVESSNLGLAAVQLYRVLVQGEDNTVFINRSLRPGDLYQTPNLVGLEITTPNAGAIEIILDGVTLGFLGASGTMAEGWSLNPQDLVDRYDQQSG